MNQNLVERIEALRSSLRCVYDNVDDAIAECDEICKLAESPESIFAEEDQRREEFFSKVTDDEWDDLVRILRDLRRKQIECSRNGYSLWDIYSGQYVR
jgi:hypothetical protein